MSDTFLEKADEVSIVTIRNSYIFEDYQLELRRESVDKKPLIYTALSRKVRGLLEVLLMGTSVQTLLSPTPVSVLVSEGVSRDAWRATVNELAQSRFGGDRSALNAALAQSGLSKLHQRPKWWVRKGVDDPDLKITGAEILESAQSADGLDLSESDAQEFALRWAFGRVKNPMLDFIRREWYSDRPSNFARVATLMSGRPVPRIGDPTLQLVARVAHQIEFGVAEFHHIAIAEHLYDCWAASRSEWHYLLERGYREHPYASAKCMFEKNIDGYGDAILKARAGLISGDTPHCLFALLRLDPLCADIMTNHMDEKKDAFDAISDLFFASAYVAAMQQAEEGPYLPRRAAKILYSASRRLNKRGPELQDVFVGEHDYALPTLLQYRDRVGDGLKALILQWIEQKRATLDTVTWDDMQAHTDRQNALTRISQHQEALETLQHIEEEF